MMKKYRARDVDSLDHLVSGVFFRVQLLAEFQRPKETRPKKLLAYLKNDQEFEDAMENLVENNMFPASLQADEFLYEEFRKREAILYFFEKFYNISTSALVKAKIAAWNAFKRECIDDTKICNILRVYKRFLPTLAGKCTRPQLLATDILKLVFTHYDLAIKFFLEHDKPFIRNTMRDALYFFFEPKIKRMHRMSAIGKKNNYYWKSYNEDIGRLVSIFTTALFTYNPQKGSLMSRVAFLIKMRALDTVSEEKEHADHLVNLDSLTKTQDDDSKLDTSYSEAEECQFLYRVESDGKYAKYAIGKLKEKLRNNIADKRRSVRKIEEDKKALRFIKEFLIVAEDNDLGKQFGDKLIADRMGVCDKTIRNIRSKRLAEEEVKIAPRCGLFLLSEDATENMAYNVDEGLANNDIDYVFQQLENVFRDFC